MANAILAWKVSEKWRKSEDGKARMFAYIYRELVEQVMWTTAVLTGGMDHAMSVVEYLFKDVGFRLCVAGGLGIPVLGYAGDGAQTLRTLRSGAAVLGIGLSAGAVVYDL